jgi:ACS family hexuronate transporter-like MFS transporter
LAVRRGDRLHRLDCWLDPWWVVAEEFYQWRHGREQGAQAAMFIFALFPLTVLLASRLGAINTWYAVATIAIACAAHQAWSANIFTTVSDMFPKKTVASVTGIGGMAGASAASWSPARRACSSNTTNPLHKIEVGYGIMFIICGLAYVTAWLIMHLLVPKFKKIVI